MAKRKVFADVWEFVPQGNPDECWNWLGCKNSTGYGSITIGQKAYSAHRVVFALTNPGLIEMSAPKDKKAKQFILHKCDNRLCCNPAHMSLGNYADNNRDAAIKGRSNAPKGAQHKKAKLTQEQADMIRKIYVPGVTYVDLANMFGLHANNVSRIVRNKAYVARGV